MPDELKADVYKNEIEPNLMQDKNVVFMHRLNIYFKLIKPQNNIDIIISQDKIITAQTKTTMKNILSDIQDGTTLFKSSA